MAGGAQRATRTLTWMGVLVGSAVSAIPLSVPIQDLAYLPPTDPPILLPVLLVPFAPVKLGVGLLFGPVAGAIAGAASQVLAIGSAGFDLAETWNWVLGGALAGAIAGWLPRRLPAEWRPSGSRRFAGASLAGFIAMLIGFIPVLLDPWLRAEASTAFAVGEYLTAVIPTAILSALLVPLLLAAALRLGIRPALAGVAGAPPARPGWRPFAIALALAFIVPLLPLSGSLSVRALGQVAGAAGPAAAPAPGTASGGEREVSVALGSPPAVDPSCRAEAGAHSPSLWAPVAVTLYNETDASLGVAWLDYAGRRDEVQSIDAGDPLHGMWSNEHLFVITDGEGACLMIVKVLGTTPIAIHLRS